jgi:hypothetical protein
MFNFTPNELKIFKKLSTPAKIQDFLDAVPINFELRGETCYSPRMVLRRNKAHCMEGAMLAATALRLHGRRPLVLDLKSNEYYNDHVVALFRQYGCWGAISKTNHAVLRYREPVYKTIRELVLSYFHEYFTDDGNKTMRSYSLPIDLSRFDRRDWMTDKENVFYIPHYIDRVKHYPILTKGQARTLRTADSVEIAAGKITDWQKNSKRRFS